MNTYSDSINHLIEELGGIAEHRCEVGTETRISYPEYAAGTRGKSSGSDYGSEEKCTLL